MLSDENTNISNLITGKHVDHVRDVQGSTAVDLKEMTKETANAPGTGAKDPNALEPEPMLDAQMLQRAKEFTQAGTPPDMCIVRQHPEWIQDKTADAKGPESTV